MRYELRMKKKNVLLKYKKWDTNAFDLEKLHLLKVPTKKLVESCHLNIFRLMSHFSVSSYKKSVRNIQVRSLTIPETFFKKLRISRMA